MRLTLQDRLLRRELGDSSGYSDIKGLYGDRAWINDLDIVNELGGHSGCVNALCWSKSGRLLASGSDDQHLNIHSYQPESSIAPFALTTTVATGHRANIFSVKFMPHSNDQTLVTCAGDGEVRVFDIENSGQSSIPSTNSSTAYLRGHGDQGGRRFNNFYHGVRYLSDGNTNARVYRSHGDRVKRIVTESSPYLFLSCSEDGEVRQWDLRLPSSAYPVPRGGRGFRRIHPPTSNVPPPLISYKRYHLDLNTISCSASQPHYIALGGAHLHCFLHDRRMIGRDTFAESGKLANASFTNGFSEHDDNAIGEATRCVRRFAPLGQEKMRRKDNGHITACRISDANPNELIASWSGDHIYSFDLVHTPDARESVHSKSQGTRKMKSRGKILESKDRKRKRKTETSTASAEGARRGSSQPRLSSQEATNGEDLALRVRYENGQSEDIPMDTSITTPAVISRGESRESPLSASHRRSRLIAKSVVKIGKLMFSLDASQRNLNESELVLTSLTPSFSSILELATTYLPRMDKIIRAWRYPVNPYPDEIRLQQTLRRNRDSSRRFIQAAGTLARVLIGQPETANGGPEQNPALRVFHQIQPATSDGPNHDTSELFRYDFLRAILLWLDGGPRALLQGFKRSPDQKNDNPRFPVSDDAELSGINEFIIPYLLRLAGGHPVPNVDASRFEQDQSRQIFQSETAAVVAFSHAIKMPLNDLLVAAKPASSSADDTGMSIVVQDRQTAFRFWGFKVGRGLLMKAGEGLDFPLVDRAFGGSGAGIADRGRVQEDINPNEFGSSSRELGQITVYDSGHVEAVMGSLENVGYQSSNRLTYQFEPPDLSEDTSSASSDEDVIRLGDLHDELADHMVADDMHDGEGGSDDEEEDEDQDDDDEDITAEERQFVFQSASDRAKLRESVQAHVPCSAHTRKYQGHCNVKTVKDVNFFGLQDEYVVSGSDCGHLFIWDKKTSQLLNILEGDGEVVNVVQGHPYEPMLAVSGIDHTIKIFSPDVRSQNDARNGTNLGTSSNDSAGHSSIMLGRRRRPPTREATTNETSTNGTEGGEGENDNDIRPRSGGLASRKRMGDSYRIVTQNDVERQGGMRDAFITRGMLAQLASRLHARRGPAGEGNGQEGDEDGDEEGRMLLLDDNCSVSISNFSKTPET